MALTPFGDIAEIYYNLGLAPIPLGKTTETTRNGKAAFTKEWQKQARNRYPRNQLEDYLQRFSERNVGVCLGTVLFDDLQLVAIDVDRDDFVEHARRAMPFISSGKRGRKGVTWFALAPKDLPTRRVKDSDGTVVEILADKEQTVLPPSIHPETQAPYVWEGEPLHEINLRSLPVINESFIFECQAIANGRGHYFIGGTLDSGESIPGINNMNWLGVSGGGDTYDSRLRCVAHMVGTGWADQDIISRIRRAQKEAVESAGDEFDWPDCERETLQMVNDARKKDFDTPTNPKGGGGGKTKIPPERRWAEWLKAQYPHPVCYQDSLFAYSDGYFDKMEDDEAICSVINTFQEATAPKAQTAVKTFKNMIYRKTFGTDKNHKICLINGTLDCKEQVLNPGSPDDELLYKLEVEWDASAECPEYDKFVEWVFGGDQDAIMCWDQFCGLSLVDDMSFQKALFLLGGGANGKSTLVGLLLGVHHQSVVSTVPVTELDDERKVTSMIGKLLNVSTEQSRINMVTDEVFKKITGGDPLTIRKLYKEAENAIYLKVRFLCLANELPPIADNSYAMKRRLMVLNCPNTISENDQDPELLNRLLTEKSGVLRRWVSALNKLRVDRKFTIPEASRRIVTEYVETSDPILMWSKTRLLKLEDNRQSSLELSIAYMDYSEWCKAMGHKAICAMPLWRRRMERMNWPVSNLPLPGGNSVDIIGAKLVSAAPGVKSMEI